MWDNKDYFATIHNHQALVCVPLRGVVREYITLEKIRGLGEPMWQIVIKKNATRVLDY